VPTLKLNVFDPIFIVLGDMTYGIESLSSKLLGDFQQAVAGYGANPDAVKINELGEVLTKILPGMTLDMAAQVDIRHVIKIAEFLAEQITDAAQPGKVKN
jgi:hypothetical protein